MKKSMLMVIVLFFCIKTIFAEEVLFTLEIHNVKINSGTINLGFYFNEQSFKNRKPDAFFQIAPANDIILHQMVLPEGEYMIIIHQDINGNGEMDYGLFGIPKEPYSFSNMKGKRPGNFNQSKIRIDNQNNRLIMPLVMF